MPRLLAALRGPLALRRGVDAACLAALALACAAQLAHLERVLDLAPWDEADYLRAGLGLLSHGLPDPEWGPLYALWYFALSPLAADPVALYELSYRLLVVLPALALYACARRLGAPAGPALCGALLFAVSMAPHVLPRPTLLALLLVLASLAAAARLRSSEAACATLGLALLLASWARPELFVAFLGVSAVLLVLLARRLLRPAGRARALLLGAAYGALALGLAALLGNPFGNTSNRRLFAFCQHFALGEVQRAALALDPWGQCEEVMRRSFGEVHSVGEAARRNPDAFRAHLKIDRAGVDHPERCPNSNDRHPLFYRVISHKKAQRNTKRVG